MASSYVCEPEEDGRSSTGGAVRDANVSRPESRTPDSRFPRTCRLTSRRQYLELYQRGKRLSSTSFALFGYPNAVGHTRMGITVTRKIGGAVVRNTIKRRLREVFRRNRFEFNPALDVVVNTYHQIRDKSVSQLEQEVVTAFERLAKRFT